MCHTMALPEKDNHGCVALNGPVQQEHKPDCLCSIEIETQLKDISSTHSFDVYRFSLSVDSCVTLTQAKAEWNMSSMF